MFPTFTLGPVQLHSYAVLMAAAFLIGTWLASQAAEMRAPAYRALTASQVIDLTGVALIGGLAGARVYYVLLYWSVFKRHPEEILAFWHGGLIWYGALFGSVGAGWVYVRLKRLSSLRVADHMAPFMALGHAIGRLGCFMQGCCYGRATQAWWGVRLPGHPEPVIPTQLLEMTGLLGLFVLLRQGQRHGTLLQYPGRASGWFLISYALLRGAIESLRGDQVVWWAGLTLQQLVSVGVGVGGLVLLAVSVRRVASSP
jgi:phosphatidylglycerol:prolipoprotein diacylglycerol transferase